MPTRQADAERSRGAGGRRDTCFYDDTMYSSAKVLHCCIFSREGVVSEPQKPPRHHIGSCVEKVWSLLCLVVSTKRSPLPPIWKKPVGCPICRPTRSHAHCPSKASPYTDGLSEPIQQPSTLKTRSVGRRQAHGTVY